MNVVDICYPGSVPNGTTLSGCTISFIGLVPDTWYAVALQVSKSSLTFRTFLSILLIRLKILLIAQVILQ